MRVCSIASGSSGNCIFIGSEQHSVLLDVGISGKRIEAGLNGIGQTGGDLDGILISHEHSDHIQGLGVMARRFGCPIYATAGTLEAIRRIPQLGAIPEELFVEIARDREFSIGDLRFRPFAVSHDAAEPVAYRFQVGNQSGAVATDMGCYTEETIRNLQYLDVLFLESNHDIRMLEAGRYPYPLKRRILGERGHLSNEDAGRLLSEVLHDNIRHISLAHLSKENNYPALAYETVCAAVTTGDNPYKARDFAISVARRDMPGDLIEI